MKSSILIHLYEDPAALLLLLVAAVCNLYTITLLARLWCQARDGQILTIALLDVVKWLGWATAIELRLVSDGQSPMEAQVLALAIAEMVIGFFVLRRGSTHPVFLRAVVLELAGSFCGATVFTGVWFLVAYVGAA